MVGEGFEPSKAVPTDLQSAPFGHSGIPPSVYLTIKDYTALPGKLQVFFFTFFKLFYASVSDSVSESNNASNSARLMRSFSNNNAAHL